MGPSSQTAFDGDVLFHEEQRLPKWLSVVVGLVGLLTMVVLVYALIRELCGWTGEGGPTGSERAICLGVVTFLFLIGVGPCIAFVLLKLFIEVRRDGLFVRYYPVHRRPVRIDLTQVVRVQAVTYSTTQYGWGIRRVHLGKAYTARGARGARLDYAYGKHLLLGSQRAEELAAAIERIRIENAA